MAAAVITKGEAKMSNGKRTKYTLKFKQEAVLLVKSDQSIAETARSLGVVEQALPNSDVSCRVGTDEGGAQHSGKDHGVFHERPEVRCTFIERHRRVWPVCVHCGVLRRA